MLGAYVALQWNLATSQDPVSAEGKHRNSWCTTVTLQISWGIFYSLVWNCGVLCEQNWRTNHSALLVVRFCFLFLFVVFFVSSHLWVLEYNFVSLSLEILKKTLIMRFMILPSSIQTGSPHCGSLICIFPKLLSDGKDKPLAPNRTIPKELGGRKVCPLQSCYFLYLSYSFNYCTSVQSTEPVFVIPGLPRTCCLRVASALLLQKALVLYSIEEREMSLPFWMILFLFCCSRTSKNELGQYVFLPNHCPDPLTENKWWICPIILVFEAGIKFFHVPSSNEYPFLKNCILVFFQNWLFWKLWEETEGWIKWLLDSVYRWKKLVRLKLL